MTCNKTEKILVVLLCVAMVLLIVLTAICVCKCAQTERDVRSKWENAHSITVYNTNTENAAGTAMEIYHAEAEEPFTVCLSNNGSLRIDFSNGDTDFVYMNDALTFVID